MSEVTLASLIRNRHRHRLYRAVSELRSRNFEQSVCGR